jgi:hypothetical protein
MVSAAVVNRSASVIVVVSISSRVVIGVSSVVAPSVTDVGVAAVHGLTHVPGTATMLSMPTAKVVPSAGSASIWSYRER